MSDDTVCRALEKLKKAGDHSIGQPLATKKQKFSIKRAKSAKRTQSIMVHPPAAAMARMGDESGGGDLNDGGGVDLNAALDVGQGDGDEAQGPSHGAHSGLNSDELLNLQSIEKFELARKAAEDESNALDNGMLSMSLLLYLSSG